MPYVFIIYYLGKKEHNVYYWTFLYQMCSAFKVIFEELFGKVPCAVQYAYVI